MDKNNPNINTDMIFYNLLYSHTVHIQLNSKLHNTNYQKFLEHFSSLDKNNTNIDTFSIIPNYIKQITK